MKTVRKPREEASQQRILFVCELDYMRQEKIDTDRRHGGGHEMKGVKPQRRLEKRRMCKCMWQNLRANNPGNEKKE